MAPRFRFFSCVVLLALGDMLTGELGQSRAQSINDGAEALDRKYNPVSGRVREMLSGGSFSPENKADLEAIDLYAKFCTYTVYQRKLDSEPGKLRKDYGEFERVLNGLIKNKGTQGMQPVAEALSNALGVRALDVLQLKEARPAHKLHNARILAKTAELGQAKLADPLIAALKDPEQNDGVRYYVLRGMGALLAPEPPVLNKDQQSKCAEAILTFLEERKGPANNAPVEELDGFRMLRREAVRALAKIHIPSFNDKLRPALVLARFAGNDERIQPPPRIDERMEAAIGLASMNAAQNRQYQPEYAAGQIAKFLGTFAQMVESDRNDEKDRNSKTKIRKHPWKADAAMLKEALAALKKNNAQIAYATQIADRGSKLLDRILAGSRTEDNERIWWLGPMSDPPNSKELFQGSADSTVKPAPPAEAAPEK
jgi:hypothetical protein